MRPLSREDITRISGCPQCGADAGAPCFQKDGKTPRNKNHHLRLEAAHKKMGMGKHRIPPKKTKKQKKSKKPRRNDGFYGSWEWAEVRFASLKMHGHRCMCCGWEPKKGRKGRLCVDHIKPRSKYPHLALKVSNTQVLCNLCNMGKSNIHEDDFRERWHGEEYEEEVDSLTAQFRATMQ